MCIFFGNCCFVMKIISQLLTTIIYGTQCSFGSIQWYIALTHFFSMKSVVKNKLIVFLKNNHVFINVFNIRSEVYTEAKVDSIFLGYQPCQLVKNYQCFSYHLCCHHQGMV
jgi:hypothetical protein